MSHPLSSFNSAKVVAEEKRDVRWVTRKFRFLSVFNCSCERGNRCKTESQDPQNLLTPKTVGGFDLGPFHCPRGIKWGYGFSTATPRGYLRVEVTEDEGRTESTINTDHTEQSKTLFQNPIVQGSILHKPMPPQCLSRQAERKEQFT